MSQDDILSLLRNGEGEFLSGQELSRRLGLSRAAVWKAVESLRKKGYEIEARTGLGYRLTSAPDALTEPDGPLLPVSQGEGHLSFRSPALPAAAGSSAACNGPGGSGPVPRGGAGLRCPAGSEMAQ